MDSAKLLVDYEKRQKDSSSNKYTEKVTDHALLEQEKNHDIMIVDALVKRFPNGALAVNGASMKMYKGQIFALLGHNGAGKTTTLNMLVGMLKPTKGNAYLLNKDIKNNMDALRQEIGLCP